MDILIQSLKRLYQAGRITDADLDRLLEQGKIDGEALDMIKQSAQAR